MRYMQKRSLRLTAALLLSLSLIGGGVTMASESPEPFPRGEEVSVKVLSYNVHHGLGGDGVFDLERIGNVLAESGADIIGIQEIDNHWSERSFFEDQTKLLAEMLGMHYVFAANLDRDPLEEGGERRQYGTAVLSKYPIIDHENTFLTSSPSEQRGLLRAMIDVKGNHIQFFNTHLGLSPEERAVQTAEVADIVKRLDKPSIIVGDLNAAPDTAEIQTMSDAFLDAFTDRNEAYTFPADQPRVRGDYIFYTDGLALESAEVIATLASDHLPVTAVYRLDRSAPFDNGTSGDAAGE